MLKSIGMESRSVACRGLGVAIGSTLTLIMSVELVLCAVALLAALAAPIRRMISPFLARSSVVPECCATLEGELQSLLHFQELRL
jgi:hypothetical protein